MADLEKMYFQIFVAEQHRSLLPFLWWKEVNLSDKPNDYEMFVHVFGGVSSGACSNYTLKLQQLRLRRNLVKKLLKLCKTTSMWMTC